MSLGRQSDKRAAIEKAVLETTEELLSEGATFAELNIERIATGAGISRTAFYFYFRDKRELLVRLTGEVNTELMAAAELWWSGEAALEDALRRIGELYDQHGALLRAVVEVSTYDEEVAQYWRSLIGRFVEATRQRIESEQQAGRAVAGPAGPMAFSMVWMVERAFYELRVQGQPYSLDEMVAGLAAIYNRTLYGD